MDESGEIRTFVRASIDLCESPIESAMLMALHKAKLLGMSKQLNLYKTFYDYVSAYLDTKDPWIVGIIPQAWLDKYRVDFLLATPTGWGHATVVVECDGYEFHHLTEEQAAADKARDRALFDMGHRVVRFRGSEIHENAAGCAHEAINRLYDSKAHRLS